MKILFAFAHPDDEAFGPCCTIRKLVQQGHDVTVSSMCNGKRPGSEHVSSARIRAFEQSCEFLGATPVIHNNPDLSMSYTDIVKHAVSVINYIRPDVVYTNNISDINADHRQLAEACMIATRPTPLSVVNELYFCEIPGSTSWSFGQIQPNFEPNVYIDVGENVKDKAAVIALYGTETRPFPDARSAEAAIAHAVSRGTAVGFRAAEAFKLVWAKRV